MTEQYVCVCVCVACDCNGLSNRCYFDEQLFRETGHGGHCLDCRENTAGPHCDRCKDNYFRISPDDRCEPCQCNPTGKYPLIVLNSVSAVPQVSSPILNLLLSVKYHW
jgi:hypothetical protein